MNIQNPVIIQANLESIIVTEDTKLHLVLSVKDNKKTSIEITNLIGCNVEITLKYKTGF
jgi:hypothetical protein